MFGGEGEKRASLIGPTVKMAVVIGVMSWFAASWLSAATDRQAVSQLAARMRADEPLTTGSIGSRAAATRLDPCVAPRR